MVPICNRELIGSAYRDRGTGALDIRDGFRYLPELDRNDVEFLIENLCCD